MASGKGTSFSIAINPPALAGVVKFSVSGVPAGVQATFSPGFTLGTEALNILTTDSTPPTSAGLTVTASDASGMRTANVGLTITPSTDFTISVTPSSQTVKPGGSATYNVAVTLASGGGPVNLSVDGLPTGATASFDNSSISASGTAMLTVTAGTQIMTVIQPMDVVGSDSSGTASASFGFAIIPADFFLSQSIGPVEVNAGGTVSGQMMVEPLFTPPGTVTHVALSASGLPTGITVTFNPSTVVGTNSATTTVATNSTTDPGDYTLTINGVDASGQNFTTIPFTVVIGNASAGFFLSASPLMEEITAGQTASFSINVSAPGGTIPPLSFVASTSVGGVGTNIFPLNTAPGAFELDVSTDPSLGTTSAAITVTGTGPNGAQSITVNVLIDSASN